MCVSCKPGDSRIYGQSDAKQMAARDADAKKLAKVRESREIKAKFAKKNKATKRKFV